MKPDSIYEIAETVVASKKYHNIDINSINELNQTMIARTIYSQDIAHEAVRNKRYIIGSYCPASGISFSHEPVVHYLARDARAECKRLANLNPGKTFLIACLEGAEMIVPKPTSISI